MTSPREGKQRLNRDLVFVTTAASYRKTSKTLKRRTTTTKRRERKKEEEEKKKKKREEDPNKKVQKNAYLLWQWHTISRFRTLAVILFQIIKKKKKKY